MCRKCVKKEDRAAARTARKQSESERGPAAAGGEAVDRADELLLLLAPAPPPERRRRSAPPTVDREALFEAECKLGDLFSLSMRASAGPAAAAARKGQESGGAEAAAARPRHVKIAPSPEKPAQAALSSAALGAGAGALLLAQLVGSGGGAEAARVLARHVLQEELAEKEKKKKEEEEKQKKARTERAHKKWCVCKERCPTCETCCVCIRPARRGLCGRRSFGANPSRECTKALAAAAAVAPGPGPCERQPCLCGDVLFSRRPCGAWCEADLKAAKRANAAAAEKKRKAEAAAAAAKKAEEEEAARKKKKKKKKKLSREEFVSNLYASREAKVKAATGTDAKRRARAERCRCSQCVYGVRAVCTARNPRECEHCVQAARIAGGCRVCLERVMAYTHCVSHTATALDGAACGAAPHHGGHA